tara:strand:+ start:108 stop:710 length:603 start_codon:yes stop_codon:yes gene_type:complete
MTTINIQGSEARLQEVIDKFEASEARLQEKVKGVTELHNLAVNMANDDNARLQEVIDELQIDNEEIASLKAENEKIKDEHKKFDEIWKTEGITEQDIIDMKRQISDQCDLIKEQDLLCQMAQEARVAERGELEEENKKLKEENEMLRGQVNTCVKEFCKDEMAPKRRSSTRGKKMSKEFIGVMIEIVAAHFDRQQEINQN